MGATQIYGLIGYPVKHSFSAAMHNAAFEELDINARYVLLEIKPEELNDFLVINSLRIQPSRISTAGLFLPAILWGLT